MTTLPKLLKHGFSRLQDILVNYSTNRIDAGIDYVGQFLDQEGIKDRQYGIYGMSVFLILTKDSHDERILYFRNQSICKFKTWIEATQKNELGNILKYATDKTGGDNSYIYELRCVIPKICQAFEACSLFST